MNINRGFIMMEILIAMSISIILLMTCVPILKNVFEEHNELILQNQLKDAITLARRISYALQMPIGLCESDDGKVCRSNGQYALLIFVDNNKGMIGDVNQMIAVVTLVKYPGKLILRSYPDYRNYIAFSPNVFSNSDNGSLWYCRAKLSTSAWAISFNKLGQTRVIDQQTITNNHLHYPCP